MRAYLALTTLLAFAITGAVAAQSAGGDFRLTREAIAGGGARSAGATFELVATVGQPAASTQAASGIVLRGGFHAAAGDAGDLLFADGFEQ